MNVQGKVKDVTNAAQNVANKVQNVVNDTTQKVKSVGRQSVANLQYVSQDATVAAAHVASMLCSPALVYLAIGATTLSSAFINGMDVSMFVIRLAKLFLWTYCINYLCHSGYTSISWGIVIIPYALIPFQMLGITKLPNHYLYTLLSQDEQEFFGI